jgi:diguanylate cyclase (GGDEF)-like protein
MTSETMSPFIQPQDTFVPPLPVLMVIGDAPTCIDTLFDIFQREYTVSVIRSADQVFETCRTRQPELILIDISVPEPNGFEICRQLKVAQDTRSIPIFFMLPAGRPKLETQAIHAGAADIIPLPINPAVTINRIKTHLTLKTQSNLLESLASVDGLTGVANRHRFDEAIEAEWRRCRRLITPLTLMMIDIDHFKAYNEIYGHLAGDNCLQEVAGILKKQLSRSHDILARFSGEVFACLLPDIYFDGAMQKAETMIRSVHDLGIPHAASKTAPVVTVSIGVIVTIPGPDRHPVEVISLVEAQLSQAKQQGRNRACGRELPGYFANTL